MKRIAFLILSVLLTVSVFAQDLGLQKKMPVMQLLKLKIIQRLSSNMKLI